MDWKIIFVLLAVSLLIAGCAKGGQRGGTNETGTGNGATGGTGTQTSGASGGSGTGGANASGDVGSLFRIDTDKPLEGSGYEVPAAGEE